MCNICPFASSEFRFFKQHYARQHQNDSNLFVSCSFGLCTYTTNNWTNFRVHCHRIHGKGQTHSVENEGTHQEANNLDECTHTIDPEYDRVTNPEAAQRFYNAQYTLSLEAEHNVPKASIDKILT